MSIIPFTEPGGNGRLYWSEARGFYREMSDEDRAAALRALLDAEARRAAAERLGLAREAGDLAAEVGRLRRRVGPL